MSNPFFKNHGPFKISEILKFLNIKNKKFKKKDKEIHDIKDLFTSKKNDITFFHSKKYKDIAKKTKASFCLTTESFKKMNYLKIVYLLIVDNVLVSTSKITSLFYPDSINDDFDETAKILMKLNLKIKLFLVKMF